MKSRVEIADALYNDADYFIETYLWIVDKFRNKVPLLLNFAQKKYSTQRTHTDLILKARKEGFSTYIEASFLHACMFHENVNAVTMSHTWDDTVIHLDRVKYLIETMGTPDVRIEVTLDKENQREIYFPKTNSRYWIGTAGSQGFGRGRDITHLHLSEVAFYSDQKVITGVMEACVPNAYKVLETTANGVGDFFHQMWEKSKKDPGSPWKRHFFAWFDDKTLVSDPKENELAFSEEEQSLKKLYKLSDRQIYWYRHKKQEMIDPNLMAQEYPSNDTEAFISSGACAFDRAGIETQIKMSRAPSMTGFLRDKGPEVEFVQDDYGPLAIWDYPEHGSVYLILADVAKGVEGGDFSAALVFDRRKREVVARWHGKIDPMDYASVLFGLGCFYNFGLLAVEVWPGPGIATGSKLQEMQYPNLYKRLEWDGTERVDKEQIGWATNEPTRQDMIATLQYYIRTKRLCLRDPKTIDEHQTFIRNSNRIGRYEARHGAHDDLVICAGMAAYILEHVPLRDYGQASKPLVATSLLPGRGVPLKQAQRSQLLRNFHSRGNV